MSIRKLKRLSLLAIFIAAVAVLLLAGLVSADHEYTSYNGSADLNLSVYDANWSSQSFLTNVSIPVTNVSLLVYRIGTPGTLTTAFYQADSSGRPTGGVLASETYNGDSLTTDTAGETITLDFSGSVLPSGNLSIVLSAASGSLGNSVEWLADDTIPTYLHGVLATTNDSGGNWTVNSSIDAMFTVDGYPSYINISEVRVFRNIFETGGQLFVIHYNVTYPTQPNEPPEQIYSVWVDGKGRELTQFDSYMTSVYFAEGAAPGSWGSSQVATINGSPVWGNVTTPTASYNINNTCYIWSNDEGSGRGGLYSYLMGELDMYSALWGYNLTYQDETLGLIPNSYGAYFLESAIPGIAAVFPVVGWQVAGTGVTDIERIDVSEHEFGSWEYQTELEMNMPAEMQTSIENMATTVGVAPNWIKAMLLLIFSLVIGSIVYASTRDSAVAIGLAAIPFAVAPLIGFLPFVWLALAGFLAIVGTAFYLWGVGRG